MEHFELLGKVLAEENLTIIRVNAPTAMFNAKTREIIIPNWNDIDPKLEKMLIFHEVGHALFTPVDYQKIVEKSQNPEIFGSILNCVEDARIEKLFKEKYPGSKRDFIAGAEIALKINLFDTEGKDVDQFGLVNRINLFFKTGVKTKVRFSKEEVRFVQKIIELRTFDEAVAVAQEIYDYLIDKYKKKEELEARSQEDDNKPSGKEYADGLDSQNNEKLEACEDEFVPQGVQAGGNSTCKNESISDEYIINKYQDQIIATTQDTFDEKIKWHSNYRTQAKVEQINYKYDPENYIIGYKKVLEELEDVRGIFNISIDNDKSKNCY